MKFDETQICVLEAMVSRVWLPNKGVAFGDNSCALSVVSTQGSSALGVFLSNVSIFVI